MKHLLTLMAEPTANGALKPVLSPSGWEATSARSALLIRLRRSVAKAFLGRIKQLASAISSQAARAAEIERKVKPLKEDLYVRGYLNFRSYL